MFRVNVVLGLGWREVHFFVPVPFEEFRRGWVESLCSDVCTLECKLITFVPYSLLCLGRFLYFNYTGCFT